MLKNKVFSEQRSFYERRTTRPILNLGSNELIHPEVMDLHTDILYDSASQHLNRYPIHIDAVTQCAMTLSRSQDEILFSPGSDAAIRAFAYVLKNMNISRIILPIPSYPAWAQVAAQNNIEVESFALAGKRDIDIDRLIKLIKNGSPSLVVVTAPNAPIGSDSLHIDDLIYIDKLCRSLNSLLVVDLCYAVFNNDIRQINIMTSQMITIFSASKSFGLASSRIAAITGPTYILQELALFGLENSVSQHALDCFAYALSNWGQYEKIWHDISVIRNNIRTELLYKGMEVPKSEANFLHIVLPTEKAEDIYYSLLKHGIRTKINTAIPWNTSIRFTIADHPMMELALSTIINTWRGH